MAEKRNETLSMRAFCERYKLRRASVIEWCGQHDIATDQGIDAENGDRILAEFKPEIALQESALAVVQETGMARQTDIEVLPDDKVLALDALSERFKIDPVELNGSQNDLIEGLQLLSAVTSIKEGQLEARQDAIAQRVETLKKTDEVLAAAERYNAHLDEQIQHVDEAAKLLDEEEKKRLKRLDELGIKRKAKK